MQDSPTVFTLHQIAEINGKPWYSLRHYNCRGIQSAYTGFRSEMRDLADQQGIQPHEFLPQSAELATTEMLAEVLDLRQAIIDDWESAAESSLESADQRSSVLKTLDTVAERLLRCADSIDVSPDLVAGLKLLTRAAALEGLAEDFPGVTRVQQAETQSGNYCGRIIGSTQNTIQQEVGSNLVISHTRGNLNSQPAVGEVTRINYSNGTGQVFVVKAPTPERGLTR